MAKRKQLSEVDFLIEQCLVDAHCERTGEMVNEGWFDTLKANVAGATSGIKQGIKNTGTRLANAGKTVSNVASNAAKGVKATGNILAGNKEGAIQSINGLKKFNKGHNEISATARDVNRTAKLASYIKSIKNIINDYMKAGGTQEELFTELGIATDVENEETEI